MGNVVNLRRFRKRKARSDAQGLAAENRARFGRSKAQKQKDAAEGEAAHHKLDLLRRDPPPGD